jgi:hypothetical protein
LKLFGISTISIYFPLIFEELWTFRVVIVLLFPISCVSMLHFTHLLGWISLLIYMGVLLGCSLLLKAQSSISLREGKTNCNNIKTNMI